VIVAVPVVETHVVRIHIVHVQVAVGVVIAVRLVVPGISQPPRTAVSSPPRALLAHSTLHGVLGAATATVGPTSYIHNQVGTSRIFPDVLAHSVIHEGPVVLVAWRPDLPTTRTRMSFSASPNPLSVGNYSQLTR